MIQELEHKFASFFIKREKTIQELKSKGLNNMPLFLTEVKKIIDKESELSTKQQKKLIDFYKKMQAFEKELNKKND